MSAVMTKAQMKRLGDIASYVPEPGFPRAAYWNTATDKKLIALGLIERADLSTPSIRLYMCKLTDAGRAALKLQPAGTDK